LFEKIKLLLFSSAECKVASVNKASHVEGRNVIYIYIYIYTKILMKY